MAKFLATKRYLLAEKLDAHAKETMLAGWQQQSRITLARFIIDWPLNGTQTLPLPEIPVRLFFTSDKTDTESAKKILKNAGPLSCLADLGDDGDLQAELLFLKDQALYSTVDPSRILSVLLGEEYEAEYAEEVARELAELNTKIDRATVSSRTRFQEQIPQLGSPTDIFLQGNSCMHHGVDAEHKYAIVKLQTAHGVKQEAADDHNHTQKLLTRSSKEFNKWLTRNGLARTLLPIPSAATVCLLQHAPASYVSELIELGLIHFDDIAHTLNTGLIAPKRLEAIGIRMLADTVDTNADISQPAK